MNLIGDNNQLFCWSNSICLWLDQFGILFGDIMLVFSIAGAIWALINLDRLRRWLRGDLPVVGTEAEQDTRWDAIIFSVSQQELPKWLSIPVNR